MRRALIRSQVVPAFLAHLVALGHNLEPILSRFELPRPLDALRGIEVPLQVVHALPSHVEALLGDPFVGVHVAEWLPRGAYGLVEFIVRSARDVREAGARLVRHHRLLNELTVLGLEERRGEAVLTHRLPGEPLCVGRHANELVVAMMVRVLRESLGRSDWAPRRVVFAHPAPPDVSALLAYFRTERLEFGQKRNELAVAEGDLTLPLASADAALLAVLDAHAMRLIADEGDASWSALREHVRVSLRDGPPRIEAAAAALGTSVRTLQRRLEERRTTFVDLVESIRKDLAFMYLEDGALIPLEIAFLLGYSDRRAFARAFKRWTGKSPSDYRARRT